MKKWGVLLLVLSVMFTMTACKPVDPEKDAATVVAEVDDAKITKGEALKVYDFISKQMIAQQAMYGYSVDPENKDFITAAKTETLALMTEGVALENKMNEFGMAFTEEDLAELETLAVDSFEEMIHAFMDAYGQTEEYARTAADEQGYTQDAIRYFTRLDMVDQRLREVATKDVTVADEEIRTRYDELVATATTTYETTPSQFGTDLVNGNPIYVRPAGYRYIQNLVIGLPDDTQTQLDDMLNSEYTLLYTMLSLQNELSSSDLDETTRNSYQMTFDNYQAEYEALEEERKALIAKGIEEIRPQAEEVLALCQAPDADFVALMAEYSVDYKNTKDSESLSNGYPVSSGSTNYVASFTEASMALEKIGDVSGLVESDYGFHILLYNGDVEPGQVPFEEVRVKIGEGLVSEKQDTVFSDAQEKWIEEANIKTYINKF